MPSDPKVSERVHTAVKGRGFEERFFFGGDAWFYRGHFALGVHHDRLVARVGPDAAGAAIDDGRAKPMDLTGRPMKGWVFIEAGSVGDALADWIDLTHDFVSTLPAKAKPKPRKKK